MLSKIKWLEREYFSLMQIWLCLSKFQIVRQISCTIGKMQKFWGWKFLNADMWSQMSRLSFWIIGVRAIEKKLSVPQSCSWCYEIYMCLCFLGNDDSFLWTKSILIGKLIGMYTLHKSYEYFSNIQKVLKENYSLKSQFWHVIVCCATIRAVAAAAAARANCFSHVRLCATPETAA